MIASRRGFLFGAGAFLAAPAIVRVSALMPISVQPSSASFTELMRMIEAAKTASYDMVAVETEMLRAAGLNFSDTRDLLMPGLRAAFDGEYEMLSGQYDKVFAGQ